MSQFEGIDPHEYTWHQDITNPSQGALSANKLFGLEVIGEKSNRNKTSGLESRERNMLKKIIIHRKVTAMNNGKCSKRLKKTVKALIDKYKMQAIILQIFHLRKSWII